eukprot:TRINITY_DN17233_c0_g1_i1.p1 TRINITY_DN17233_c0_g1~~TRINITY_DN17233_c0_g1_i1.p1  ORF type:complete len:899 (+),score=267.49 TRINITY_DN17233_c0_g1_i1:40-2736(+)
MPRPDFGDVGGVPPPQYGVEIVDSAALAAHGARRPAWRAGAMLSPKQHGTAAAAAAAPVLSAHRRGAGHSALSPDEEIERLVGNLSATEAQPEDAATVPRVDDAQPLTRFHAEAPLAHLDDVAAPKPSRPSPQVPQQRMPSASDRAPYHPLEADQHPPQGAFLDADDEAVRRAAFSRRPREGPSRESVVERLVFDEEDDVPGVGDASPLAEGAAAAYRPSEGGVEQHLRRGAAAAAAGLPTVTPRDVLTGDSGLQNHPSATARWAAQAQQPARHAALPTFAHLKAPHASAHDDSLDGLTSHPSTSRRGVAAGQAYEVRDVLRGLSPAAPSDIPAAAVPAPPQYRVPPAPPQQPLHHYTAPYAAAGAERAEVLQTGPPRGAPARQTVLDMGWEPEAEPESKQQPHAPPPPVARTAPAPPGRKEAEVPDAAALREWAAALHRQHKALTQREERVREAEARATETQYAALALDAKEKEHRVREAALNGLAAEVTTREVAAARRMDTAEQQGRDAQDLFRALEDKSARLNQRAYDLAPREEAAAAREAQLDARQVQQQRKAEELLALNKVLTEKMQALEVTRQNLDTWHRDLDHRSQEHDLKDQALRDEEVRLRQVADHLVENQRDIESKFSLLRHMDTAHPHPHPQPAAAAPPNLEQAYDPTFHYPDANAQPHFPPQYQYREHAHAHVPPAAAAVADADTDEGEVIGEGASSVGEVTAPEASFPAGTARELDLDTSEEFAGDVPQVPNERGIQPIRPPCLDPLAPGGAERAAPPSDPVWGAKAAPPPPPQPEEPTEDTVPDQKPHPRPFTKYFEGVLPVDRRAVPSFVTELSESTGSIPTPHSTTKVRSTTADGAPEAPQDQPPDFFTLPPPKPVAAGAPPEPAPDAPADPTATGDLLDID